MRWLTVAYLRLSALRPPWANVLAQSTQRTNAFAVARGDKLAMRPLVDFGHLFVIIACHVLYGT